MNALLGSLALWPVEQLINQLLGSDPHIEQLLARFSGRCLAIEARRPGFTVTLQFNDGAVSLSGQTPEVLGIEADARLSGEAATLLQLLTLDTDRRPLANPALHVSGDVQFLQDLHHSLQHLDLDWQDMLQPILGDVMTHELGRFQGSSREFVEQTRTRLGRSLRDYLQEEARWVPAYAERSEFDAGLTQLKLGLDRAEARLARITARLHEGDEQFGLK